MNSIVSNRIIYLFLTLVIISIPLSIPFGLGTFQINFPVEPLLIVVSIFLFLGIGLNKLPYSAFFLHPLTLLSLLYQSYIIVSVFFSIDPFISAKYSAVSICHFWVFYFGTYFILTNQYDLNKIIKYFSLLLGCVVLFAFARLSLNQFNIKIIPEIPRPFFSDHTLFGATIGFVIPIVFIHLNSYYKKEKIVRVLLVLLLIGLAITLSRAVWFSLLVSFFAYFVLHFKLIRPKLISIIFLVGLFIALSFITTLSTENNYSKRSETEFKTPFTIKDVSILERLNRYSCAYRMWLARPLLGFGIGTFQFTYFPYQLNTQMTRISVTSERQADGKPHSSGKGGGVHSEYMQALAELGLIGFITWMTLIFMSVYYGLSLYILKDKFQLLYLSIIISLLGFYTHAIFNNFLHNEEISFLFWSCLAIIAHKHSKSKFL